MAAESKQRAEALRHKKKLEADVSETSLEVPHTPPSETSLEEVLQGLWAVGETSPAVAAVAKGGGVVWLGGDGGSGGGVRMSGGGEGGEGFGLGGGDECGAGW